METRKGRIITSCDMSIVILIVIFGTTTLPWRMKKFWKLLAVVMVLDILYWVRTSSLRYKSGSQYFLNYLGFYVLYYILMTQEIFFWHLVYLINIKLTLLNECLEVEEQFMEHEKCIGDITLVNYHIDTLYLKTFLSIGEMSKIHFRRRFPTLQDSNAGRMRILGNFHKIVSDGVQLINSTMSNGIMFIMLSCLVHLIITPYFLLAELMKDNGSTLFMFLVSLWIVVHTGRLLILVEPCHRCSREGQRTTTLACELLRLDEIEEHFKTAIASFNAQVAQNRIQFSCSGLFTIDRSLITSIASSVTTYIVIVFQFRN
ncbi:hypothetical protein JTB14_021742 [Gonioctena quinquepunctata]|nr:hypothetical protein JTB14_021742 [Gonioctena quinquepunctata]